jgi:hypothetical protein
LAWVAAWPLLRFVQLDSERASIERQQTAGFVRKEQSQPWSGRSVSDGVAVAVSDLPLAVLAPVHLGGPQGVGARLTVC